MVDDKGKMHLGGAEAAGQGGAKGGRGVSSMARRASAQTEMGCSGMMVVRVVDTGRKAPSNQG